MQKPKRQKTRPTLAEWLSELLSEEVEEVRLSSRLTDSPSVLVDADGGMSSNFQNIMKAINPGQDVPDAKLVLRNQPISSIVCDIDNTQRSR